MDFIVEYYAHNPGMLLFFEKTAPGLREGGDSLREHVLPCVLGGG